MGCRDQGIAVTSSTSSFSSPMADLPFHMSSHIAQVGVQAKRGTSFHHFTFRQVARVSVLYEEARRSQRAPGNVYPTLLPSRALFTLSREGGSWVICTLGRLDTKRGHYKHVENLR